MSLDNTNDEFVKELEAITASLVRLKEKMCKPKETTIDRALRILAECSATGGPINPAEDFPYVPRSAVGFLLSFYANENTICDEWKSEIRALTAPGISAKILFAMFLGIHPDAIKRLQDGYGVVRTSSTNIATYFETTYSKLNANVRCGKEAFSYDMMLSNLVMLLSDMLVNQSELLPQYTNSRTLMLAYVYEHCTQLFNLHKLHPFRDSTASSSILQYLGISLVQLHELGHSIATKTE